MEGTTIVPNSANEGETGNTIVSPSVEKKQCNKAKNWCFTLNNYTEDEIVSILSYFRENCIKYIFETEVGECGTPHLQGYIELKEKARWTEFKLSKRISWRVMSKKSSEGHNIEYCSKDFRKGLPVRIWKSANINIPKPLKIITDLRPWQLSLEKILLTEPDDRKIMWIWEEEGGAGKTQMARYICTKYDALYGTKGKRADVMNLVYNYILVKELVIMIINIPREDGNDISYGLLEEIKDGLICNLKFETGSKVINSPHICIFANLPPKKKRLSADKWDIYKIINGELCKE